MNFLNLIYSSDFFLFKKKTDEIIQKIIKEKKLNKEIQTITFYLEEKNKIPELINELNKPNFFNIKKIIININKLEELSKKEQLLLIENLKKTKNPTFLFRDIKLKIKNNDLEKNSNIINISKINKFKKEKFIKEKLEKNFVYYEFEIIDWIIQNTMNNFLSLNNELNKIIFYYFSNKKLIKLSDVKEILTPIKNNNFFDLFNEILKNNKKKCLKIYQKLSKNKISDIKLIFTIETYIWYFKKIEYLSKKKLNYIEIAKLLKKNPFFILNIQKIYKKQNSSIINLIIKKWCKLEYNIKIGLLSTETLFKYFLIS